MWSMSCARVGLNQRFLELPSCKVKRRSLWRRTPGVCCLFSPTQNVPVQMPSLTSIATGPISVSSLLEIVADDLHKLNTNLKSLIGAENPVLVSAAEQIFGAGGKRLRPALVFLVSRATAQLAGLKELTVQHQRLAEIIEIIYTASFIHNDVIDDSGLQRGKQTTHQLYGTQSLREIFMFAQSS